MNLGLLLMIRPKSMKKLIILVIVTLAVVVSLPVMAVFALGTGTLSFLSSSPDITQDSGTQTIGLYQGPEVPGDYYEWGNCTYWVFYLRQQAGDPIPTDWGNASSWAVNAILQGYQVDHIPSPGAIMQTPNVDNGLGHVAYVTKVDPISGAWTISEMNVEGLDIVDTTSYPAAAALNFNFIHDKSLTPINHNLGQGLL